MDGGAARTNGDSAGTSGGPAVTSRMTPRRLQALLVGATLAYGAMMSFVNGASRHADLASAGRDRPVWMIVAEEASSFVLWACLFAVIWQLVLVLRPPRFSWSTALGLHLLASVPVSFAHVLGMFSLRWLVFALHGEVYEVWGRVWHEGLYEYRKDLTTYVMLAAACGAIQWVVARRLAAEAPVAMPEPGTLEVPDGAVTHRIPIDKIEWVEATGNYVTIHRGPGTLLHRSTLAALESQLAPHGFARIHRSRLVRLAAIRRVETIQSGDFVVTLDDGTLLRGSRRYRHALG